MSPEDQVREFGQRLRDRCRREQADLLAFGRELVARHEREEARLGKRIEAIGKRWE